MLITANTVANLVANLNVNDNSENNNNNDQNNNNNNNNVNMNMNTGRRFSHNKQVIDLRIKQDKSLFKVKLLTIRS